MYTMYKSDFFLNHNIKCIQCARVNKGKPNYIILIIAIQNYYYSFLLSLFYQWFYCMLLYTGVHCVTTANQQQQQQQQNKLASRACASVHSLYRSGRQKMMTGGAGVWLRRVLVAPPTAQHPAARDWLLLSRSVVTGQ